MKSTNLKLKLILLFLVCFCVGTANSQQRLDIDVQEWPSGKVVLVSGDTIYGSLVFYRSQDIVNIEHEDGTISAFSPVNVEYFVAQERPSGRPYFFRTLMWDQGRDYSDFKKPSFFEQLIEGPLTLVMRESYAGTGTNNFARDLNANYLSSDYYNAANMNKLLEQIKEQFYVLLPDGEVVTLRKVRRDLHDLFGDKSKEVKKYVKEHNLSYEKPHEVMAIVSYFNSLVVPSQVSQLKVEIR